MAQRHCKNCGEICEGRFCSHDCECDFQLAMDTDPIGSDYDDPDEFIAHEFDEAYDEYPESGYYEQDDYYPEYDNDCDLWNER